MSKQIQDAYIVAVTRTPVAKRKLGYYALPLLWREAVIGWANAARNRSPWPWRVAGALVTTALGLLVIGLSIIAH